MRSIVVLTLHVRQPVLTLGARRLWRGINIAMSSSGYTFASWPTVTTSVLHVVEKHVDVVQPYGWSETVLMLVLAIAGYRISLPSRGKAW